jgi:aryl-alcohol dehydrogenase-like predicted oxidoreductase
MHASLQRLQMDHVDLVYCHRPDPHTPIEETVWAMSDLIQRGDALYWGTSEWSAEEIRTAIEIAAKHHLRAPIVEQPEYNLLHRKRVEQEYSRLYQDYNYGLTTWSPLASGILTGKYLKEIPPGTRASMRGLSFVTDAANDLAKKSMTAKFIKLAQEINCNPGQLAIAWCVKNKNVSSVITGSSKVEQLHENLKSLPLLSKLTPDVMSELDQIFGLNT